MELISNLFLANLSIHKISKYDRSGFQKGWRARNTSQAGAEQVSKYFTNFPLFSSKYLDFLCWQEAHKIILNKEHLKKKGLEGILKLKQLKNSMNNNRIDFTWNHLNQFYLQ